MARIFIIEDEPVAAKNISRILKEEGYEIAGIASDCEKASEMINTKQVDLVVCNLYLKFTFSGKDIIQLIRSVKNIPFVFLSSYTHDARLNSILRTKSEIYLSSPYTKEQLLGSINRLLRNLSRFNSSNVPPLIVL
ncbi:MAG TPA: response regulator [Bacteroidales bacterium]